MRILIVSNQIFEDGRVSNPIMPRMRDSLLRDSRVNDVVLMPVVYSLAGMRRIRNAAKQTDIVHVHFGGLYALAVWFFLIGISCPKVITFHGTDIHAKAIKTAKNVFIIIKIKLNQIASFITILLFNRVGFVAEGMKQYIPRWMKGIINNKSFIQSLGVDYHIFYPIEKTDARAKVGIGEGMKVLFSTISNCAIKRQDIAEAIVKELGPAFSIVIMCGVHPDDVPVYINACDLLVLTSDEEGSPNIIRECLALNKPVFSVDVGDASLQLKGLRNSCIIERNPSLAAKVIKEKLKLDYIDNTREKMKNVLDFDSLNMQIIDMYYSLI